MARYIDAEALTAEFKRLTLGENSLIERLFADGVYAVIETFPTADVVEVKRGKWISASVKANVGMKCNICGARIKYSEFFNGNHNFCHKCGAKMDGKTC